MEKINRTRNTIGLRIEEDYLAGGIAVTLLLVLTFSIAVGCGARKVHIAPTALVPAADATAKLETDDNGNSKIQLEVEHLATPEGLTPPATAYVVWVQPRGEAAQNQGVLRVDEDLEGSFTAITPYKSFALLVTAEGNPKAVSPSGPVILRRELAR